MDPYSQATINYLHGEQKRVRYQMISLTTVIDTLHIISLPTELTINEGNAEIQVIEKGLTLRSKKLLKRGRWAPKPVSMTQEEPIKYESRPDPAIYCRLLYGPCDSQSDDDEPVGHQSIYTNDIGSSGEDLTDGVLAVDGARVLLTKVRQEAKGIKYLDLRDYLIGLVDKWRAFLNSRLQYFVNMLLFPIVNYGKKKVKLHFDGYWMEPREFTVNVNTKDRRGIKHESSYFLRSLQEVVKDISDTAVEAKDLCSAFGQLKLLDEDYELLLPLVKRVLDAVRSLLDGNDMDHKHRLSQLQQVMKDVSLQLIDPEIMTNLKQMKDDQMFWTSVDLKSLVQWRVQKVSMKDQH